MILIIMMTNDAVSPFSHVCTFSQYLQRSEPLKDEANDSILYFPDFIHNAMNFLVRHGVRKVSCVILFISHVCIAQEGVWNIDLV